MVIKKVKKIFKTIYRYINSTILCLRFPFLYPRNRFTGRHYTNWRLEGFINELKSISKDSFFWEISETDEAPKGLTGKVMYLHGHRYTIYLYKGVITIRGLETVNIKVEDIIESGELFSVDFRECTPIPHIILHVSTGTVFKDTFNKYESKVLAESANLKFIIKCINIWYSILSIFHIGTSYTELDALDTGWRKAFGVKICKEIKKALLKEGGYKALHRYRIAQIKEKFGFLHWYDCNDTKSVQEIISKYEDISYHTCVVCGKPATKLSTGWICPYCDEHAPERSEPFSKEEIVEDE